MTMSRFRWRTSRDIPGEKYASLFEHRMESDGPFSHFLSSSSSSTPSPFSHPDTHTRGVVQWDFKQTFEDWLSRETTIRLQLEESKRSGRVGAVGFIRGKEEDDYDDDDGDDESDRAGLGCSFEWLLSHLGMDTSIAKAVVEALRRAAKKRGDGMIELQSELWNLLGETRVELIGEIIQGRESLLKSAEAVGITRKGSSRRGKGRQKVTKISLTTSDAVESSIDSRKLDSKRRQKLLSALEDERMGRENVFALDGKGGGGGGVMGSAAKKYQTAEGRGGVLPEGTEHRVFDKYEQLTIPPKRAYSTIGVAASHDDLVPVSEMQEEWARKAFSGFKTLNRIQSKVFPCAYHSNENILICAPTGAGKTNIALLTILRVIRQHQAGDMVHLDQFKIVYIAPMKALAAEMTSNFSHRLSHLNVQVRELTGDMQLSRYEMQQTQVFVTTPEKWDVVTRKGHDLPMLSLVRLVIIDEIHLLNDERGPVLESLVARTIRTVETTQRPIRLVGLSATLPNYQDVADFMHVDVQIGLHYFDDSFRPVPLEQRFIGVTDRREGEKKERMNFLCFKQVARSLRSGNQVLVFVHARKETVRTGEDFMDRANHSKDERDASLFLPGSDTGTKWGMRELKRSKNVDLRKLSEFGIGIHHAGMLRSDRNLVESLFRSGYLRVLVCTATLAWGVNLPAHTVVIKGTEIYDPEKGCYVDVGILDVLQIFGRAGRPQYDTSGEGVIITTQDKMYQYARRLTHSMPIESQLHHRLEDHLNAEISLRTVTDVDDAIQWLRYTFLYVRLMKDPLKYMMASEIHSYEYVEEKLREWIELAAEELRRSRMIRVENGKFYPVEFGRIASHYYIRHETMRSILDDKEGIGVMNSLEKLLELVGRSSEFSNVHIRDDETAELSSLAKDLPIVDTGAVRYTVPAKKRRKGEEEDDKSGNGGGEMGDELFAVDRPEGKVSLLLLAYIGRKRLDTSSLVSDTSFVVQNASRLFRGFFEICMKNGWVAHAHEILRLCRMVDRRLWEEEAHPLRQFEGRFPHFVMEKLEASGLNNIEDILAMSADEIGSLVRFQRAGKDILQAAKEFPRIDAIFKITPITNSIVRVQVEIVPLFRWNQKYHGESEPFWLWIEDEFQTEVYHYQHFFISRKREEGNIQLDFVLPLHEMRKRRMCLIVESDRWMHCMVKELLDVKDIFVDERRSPMTDLLPLAPLPVSILHHPQFQTAYPFSFFNPIQTQIFHIMYHSDENALVGAPTGSGKTVSAELAFMRLFREYPGKKCVYVGPLKALVRERLRDWKKRFGKWLKIMELTGDHTPDARVLAQADIVLTTPEKWDGVSRNWKQRAYVRSVGLMIFDEIHMLGQDRGPILEVIVSRMRYIATNRDRDESLDSQQQDSTKDSPMRLVGLSTALANPLDLCEWLGVRESVGLFNFRPSTRPVPVEVHLQGYAGRHYCPRMATMNKPAYDAIHLHSERQPVLVFVSSRRQTRLTALDLIALSMGDGGEAKPFLRMSEQEVNEIASNSISDASLQHTLRFGIGLHHAGLCEGDRRVVESLFGNGKIQILVSTSTLAWGVNLPAHLVIIKGTEYYDAKKKGYVDFAITDVLQMIGRAGRPQFDDKAVAVVMVHEPKKEFYRKFLYDPFPVESSLHRYLTDHLNAEIVGGTITDRKTARKYIEYTYMRKRIQRNPAFYGLHGTSKADVESWINHLLDESLKQLDASGCIRWDKRHQTIESTWLGSVASFYYLSHHTMLHFSRNMKENMTELDVLSIVCNAYEYVELPVRHNEDGINLELSHRVPYNVDRRTVEKPETKANLLFQCHFSRLDLPISDYVTDLNSVLDQSIRISQALIDMVAEKGRISTTRTVINFIRMCIQAMWSSDSPLLQLPHVSHSMARALESGFKGQWDKYGGLVSLVHGMENSDHAKLIRSVFFEILGKHGMRDKQILSVVNTLCHQFPRMSMNIRCLEDDVDTNEDEDDARYIHVSFDWHGDRHSMKKQGEYAYTPRFRKEHEESLFVIACDADLDILHSMQRIRGATLFSRRKITLPVPKTCKKVRVIAFFDCYFGLDMSKELEI
eukprot:TRINITY_DN1524_c3_g1_i1.p1 TRINITY_DN1524_c3_g1~~TRINITY_DN1524_c3_g1_i1.p1  ORF type:complete len:2063 (+),score=572.47 TRINITY_DN1524_c3_g1_i1:42-6230(+)